MAIALTAQSSRPRANQALEPVIRRLSATASLSRSEIANLEAGVFRRRNFDQGSSLSGFPAPRKDVPFLVSGWACHERVLSDGRRQIVDLLVPGDVCAGLDCSSSITPVCLTAVETIEFIWDSSDIARGLYLSQIAFASRERQRRIHEHLVRLGQLTAKERMAHVVLELYGRLAVVGLAKEWRFHCPLSQEIFGDFLGLTVVHVNRVLRSCRQERLVEFTCGYVQILQPRLLAQLAQFELV